ncbi:MAG: ribbon-helix-helix protein, CopG family [Planctomycetes bacterium]|nr:ribbon-helix-helix protein, CopG family [Planctomycetota bacterium]
MNIFDPTPKRTKQINILLSPVEKKRLDAAAKKADLSNAEFIREAINSYAERIEKRKKRS